MQIPVFSVVLLATGFLFIEARAAISITDFTLTTNSVTFNISGTFPTTLPAAHKNVFFFVNSNNSADPGFAIGDWASSDTSSFTGTQPLRFSWPVGGSPSYDANYFYVAFSNDFSAGEAISGTLTAQWNITAFDPAAVNSLDVYWGGADVFTVNSGNFIMTTPIPEPSTVVFFLGATTFAGLRRRRN